MTITIARDERYSRAASGPGRRAQYQFRLHAAPTGPALARSLPHTSVERAKRAAESLFGPVAWRGLADDSPGRFIAEIQLHG